MTFSIKSIAHLLALCVVLPVITACTTTITQDAPKSILGFDTMQSSVLKQSERQFVNLNPMTKFAPAYADFSKSGHGTFGQITPNFATPWHSHSGAYHGVVIKGKMTNPFRGEVNPPEMLPGSHWYVPGGMDHITACVSDTPCEFYFHANEAFDFTPAE